MAVAQLRKVSKALRRVALMHELASLPDSELINQFALSGDEAAFEALVKRHGPMVLRVCQRVLGHKEDAEDAFQATFLVLAKKAVSIRYPNLLGNWLYGVAYKTALKAKRSRARNKMTYVSEVPETAAAGDQDWHRDLRQLLDTELSLLNAKYRAPIVLCDLEGMSRSEAAARIGIPEGTLSSRLHEARIQLAQRLTRRSLAISGGSLATLLAKEAASASLPPAMISAATKGALLCAAGEIAAAGISPQVIALAQGILRDMSAVAALKVGLSLIVILGVAVAAPAYWRSNAVQAGEVPPEGQARIAVVGKDGHRGWADPAEDPQVIDGADSRITSPVKSQKLSRPFEVRGFLGKDAPNHVWLAVKLGEAPNELYWPKHDLTAHKGRHWTRTIDEPANEFAIVLLSVPPEGEAIIRPWIDKRQANFPGLTKPALFSAKELDIVDGLRLDNEP